MMEEIFKLVLALLFGGAGGGLLTYFFAPKSRIIDQDDKIRDELWKRVQHLEGRLDEQTKLLISVLKENATLQVKNETMQNQLNLLKSQYEHKA